jgi:predicted nucleotide-binding protein (sugar kinase/HSP70/actin superfamily)
MLLNQGQHLEMQRGPGSPRSPEAFSEPTHDRDHHKLSGLMSAEDRVACSRERCEHSSSGAADDRIDERLEHKRRQLEAKLGLRPRTVRHYRRPVENPFLRSQRAETTLLFGGLTWSHEHLISGVLRGLGYACIALPTPDVEAFQIGKEYGNNGNCNPAYFTAGNLVKYLQGLAAAGESREDIINQYVFVTAGGCGPCRFGMYEAEFRLALENAGFAGFRVVQFQQRGGLNRKEQDAGLELNLDFFLGFINALNVGDLINGLGYQIRPFEVVAGQTNEVLQNAVEDLHDVMYSGKRKAVRGAFGRVLAAIRLEDPVNYLVKFFDQLTSPHYTRALERTRDAFDQVGLDRFRVKPIVKVTGEFWAQTTEGDGNYNMFRFLEGEGAEVLIEPVATWIMYLLSNARQYLIERRRVDPTTAGRLPAWRVDRRVTRAAKHYQTLLAVTFGEYLYKREYDRFRKALGGTLSDLVDQYELIQLSQPYYHSRATGGEGHLEVAKNIYYHDKALCHMVLGLKPFGCMPSTQSDGVQTAVIERYREMIYLPIETSGEGEINAHSRLQMALGNARIRAKQEFADALSRTGRSLSEMKRYVDEHPELKRPLYIVPRTEGVVGTAANFVLHIADLMDRSTSSKKSPRSSKAGRSDRFGEASQSV